MCLLWKACCTSQLEQKKLNGLKGYLGGYNAATRLREVKLDGRDDFIAITPMNIFSCIEGEDEVCIYDQARNLINDCDRLGATSFHEVYMSTRVDVAKFLIKHNSSVDVTPPCGNSVRVLASLPPAMMFTSEMQRVVKAYISRG